MNTKVIAGFILLAAGPASAQDFTLSASLYGWVPGLSASAGTRFGEVESDATGSDALDALDMAFMGTLEARNGRWGLIGDLLYAKLSADADSPLDLRFSDADLETEVTAFSGYALYRTYEDTHLILDAGGGFRAFGIGLDIRLNSADSRPDFESSQDTSWVVPLVAVRAIVPFNEKWFATAFVDGGLTADNTTWQVFGSVGYRFDERWSTQLGYRHMTIEKDFGEGDVTIDLSGPLIGVTARF